MSGLTTTEQMLIEILHEIADKMNADASDKIEIMMKIEKLKSQYWYENTGWK